MKNKKQARSEVGGRSSKRARPVRRRVPCKVLRRVELPVPGVAAPSFFWGRAVVGPLSGANELFATITGLGLQNDVPATVLVQPRQSDNTERGWLDVFATQVVATARDSIVVHVIRLDQRMTGWGQQLEVDLFIVDSPT